MTRTAVNGLRTVGGKGAPAPVEPSAAERQAGAKVTTGPGTGGGPAGPSTGAGSASTGASSWWPCVGSSPATSQPQHRGRPHFRVLGQVRRRPRPGVLLVPRGASGAGCDRQCGCRGFGGDCRSGGTGGRCRDRCQQGGKGRGQQGKGHDRSPVRHRRHGPRQFLTGAGLNPAPVRALPRLVPLQSPVFDPLTSWSPHAFHHSGP